MTNQTTRSEPSDEMFAEPYIDVDEWRDSLVRHLYVHGGFAGTETRFSISIAESVAVAEKVDTERQYSFAAPGVYFPTVRVAAHRNGDKTSPYARVQNLARVRVVVSSLEPPLPSC